MDIDKIIAISPLLALIMQGLIIIIKTCSLSNYYLLDEEDREINDIFCEDTETEFKPIYYMPLVSNPIEFTDNYTIIDGVAYPKELKVDYIICKNS